MRGGSPLTALEPIVINFPVVPGYTGPMTVEISNDYIVLTYRRDRP